MNEDPESLVRTLRKTCYKQCRQIAQLRARVSELEEQLDRVMVDTDYPDPNTMLVEVPAEEFGICQLPEFDQRQRRVLRKLLGDDAITVGSHPYSETDLDALLGQCGIQVYEPPCDVEVMIAGRHQWSVDALDSQLKERVGRRLRVYSQEMVFEAVTAGHELFGRLSVAQLLRLAGDHPALEYLRLSGFAWPSAVVRLGRSELVVNPSWLEEGLLKHLGYKVGRNAPTAKVRRTILSKAYQADLIPAKGVPFGEPYLARWGKPGSKQRLKEMAFAIASFIWLKQARSDAASFRHAISHWQSDLDWLRSELYRSWMEFRWPNTEV